MKNLMVQKKDVDVEGSLDDADTAGSVTGNGTGRQEDGASSGGEGDSDDSGVSNVYEIFGEEEFVEKKGLRGKHNGKNGLTVVEEGRE